MEYKYKSVNIFKTKPFLKINRTNRDERDIFMMFLNFENMLENIIVLASFIPIIIGMGGNVGTQSSTIVVRGMATGRITIGNELTIILKELNGLLYPFFSYFFSVSHGGQP